MIIPLYFSLCCLKGTGLSAKELEICDFFVYIPQYGGGTASLNVTVAASIVLHQFGGNHKNMACIHPFCISSLLLRPCGLCTFM